MAGTAPSGKITNPNGDVYSGQIIDDLPDGWGTMHYADGGYRAGFWKLGLPITKSVRDMAIPGVKDDSFTNIVECGGCRFCVGYGYDNDTIAEAFGVSRYYRGIRIHRNNCVLISTGDSVYRDGFGWMPDQDGLSTFVYTGEGLHGDQSMTSGNAFLSQSTGKLIVLFIKRKPNDYVFHGVVAVKRIETAIEPDKEGAPRKVFKFILGRL